jgi:hypothetical protein
MQCTTNNKKILDLKPAYGSILKGDIENYDFLGFCDMDIIWEILENSITNDPRKNYDTNF